ncbi:hypothetical protein BRD22_08925 [Halobacteriales archaeon SW_8_68_21]|nr:MAG: hypothetical protein BRD22_08925 [Halobacteriales archaeon SW_8_68_21]
MVFTYFVSSGAEKWFLGESFRIVYRHPRLRGDRSLPDEGRSRVSPRTGLPDENRRIELSEPAGA